MVAAAAFIAAVLSAGPGRVNAGPITIADINADSVDSSYLHIPGLLTIQEDHIGVSVNRQDGSTQLFPDAFLSLSSLLTSDTSSGGLASGSFANGSLRVRDNAAGPTDLLLGSMVALDLSEVEFVFGTFVSRQIVATGSFAVTGGTLASDFGPQGQIAAAMYSLSTNPSDFSTVDFSGQSKVSLLPVPEPSSLALLVPAGLTTLMVRPRRRH